MGTTAFDPTLLGLFDAPAPKAAKEPAKAKHNFALRLAYQQAKAWASQPHNNRAYVALCNLYAEYGIDLAATLNITPITAIRKDAANKPVLDENKKPIVDITGYDVSKSVIPNTKDDDLSDPMWDELMPKSKEFSEAFKAYKASLAPAK